MMNDIEIYYGGGTLKQVLDLMNSQINTLTELVNAQQATLNRISPYLLNAIDAFNGMKLDSE